MKGHSMPSDDENLSRRRFIERSIEITGAESSPV